MQKLLIILAVMLAMLLVGSGMAAQTLISTNQINWTQNVGSQIHGVTNGTAAQDAVTYSQMMTRMEGFINVRDYGATGDNSTDDTAAINSALAVANFTPTYPYSYGNRALRTLYFPPGRYKVTPGGLGEIRCNIYGPQASLVARTSGSSPLLLVKQKFYGGSILLHALEGYNADLDDITGYTATGKGLSVGYAGGWPGNFQFDIGCIYGFATGIELNAWDDHVGGVKGYIGELRGNIIGISMVAQYDHCEDNEINIGYAVGNNYTVYMAGVWSADHPHGDRIMSNIIDIRTAELHQGVNEVGIYIAGGNTTRNTMRIHYVVHGDTSQIVQVATGAYDNIVDLPAGIIDAYIGARPDNIFNVDGGTYMSAVLTGTPSHTSNGNWQEFPTASWSELLDSDSAFSSGVFTVPWDGVYDIDLQLSFGSDVDGHRGSGIYKNGAAIKQTTAATILDGYDTTVPCHWSGWLESGDLIKFYGFQNSGGNLPYSPYATYNLVQITRSG